MGPRAALAVAVAVALAGCDAADNNIGGGQDMGIASVHDLAGFHCANIQISALDPTTGSVLCSGPGGPNCFVPAKLSASVDLLGASGAHWSLQHDNDAPVTPMATDSTGHRVEYEADVAGTWTFSVYFDTGPCPGSAFINLSNATAATQMYRLRAIPPESLNAPLTDLMVTVTGGANLTKDLNLADGVSAPGTLEIAGNAAAGEVRFVAANGGPDAVAFAGSDGKFSAVLGSGNYTPVLIPQAKQPAIARAPHQAAQADSSTFFNAVFDIPGGVAVTGSVTDNAAAAIDGAHVVLRATLPSGPGASDATGAYTLYAEPGTYAMTFGADGWPEGSVDNVVVPAGGTTASIAYTIGRFAVGGSVVGENPAGARVTITSHDPLANVADVVAGGGAPVHAGGRVARVLFANSDGSLPPLQLPLGTYDVLVEPAGPSSPNQGLTMFSEVVAGPATWMLTLAKTVTLTVTVTGPDGKAAQGALLTAFETVGLGAAPTCVTDVSGQCKFNIDRDAPISLLVDPQNTPHAAGTRVSVPAGGGTVPVTLGPGVQVSGVVRLPSSSSPAPGVRVEALCASCGSTTPLATAISDGNGVYRIYLPDPGFVGLDGGVTD